MHPKRIDNLSSLAKSIVMYSMKCKSYMSLPKAPQLLSPILVSYFLRLLKHCLIHFRFLVELMLLAVLLLLVLVMVLMLLVLLLQVGSAESGWSKTLSFVAPNPSVTDTSALLFSDMGTYVPYRTFNCVQYDSTNTMKWLLREQEDRPTTPTLVSHIGDISYARGYSWL